VVTVMGERGAPTPVAWARLRAPESLMAPSSPESIDATVKASPRFATYSQVVDRESARELLAERLEEGARKAEEQEAAEAKAKEAKKDSAKSSGSKSSSKSGGVVSDVVKSSAFKDFMRTAAREIVRGAFGAARR
jgi:Arc/MetJ-type ribon-helix-helix transcriptional regulator